MKCPDDQVEYEGSKTTFEYHDIIIPNVPCLRCPKCKEILFSLSR